MRGTRERRLGPLRELSGEDCPGWLNLGPKVSFLFTDKPPHPGGEKKCSHWHRTGPSLYLNHGATGEKASPLFEKLNIRPSETSKEYVFRAKKNLSLQKSCFQGQSPWKKKKQNCKTNLGGPGHEVTDYLGDGKGREGLTSILTSSPFGHRLLTDSGQLWSSLFRVKSTCFTIRRHTVSTGAKSGCLTKTNILEQTN